MTHANDPFGHHADAARARARLAELDQHEELQRQLPDLHAQRDAILRDKQEVAVAIGAFGPEARHEANPERQRLHDRLVALNLSLESINRQINAIPSVMAACDRAAHLEDLRGRAGT